jgi:hypothetical protein
LAPFAHTSLAEQLLHDPFHRALRDADVFSNLSIRKTSKDPQEYLLFSIGQSIPGHPAIQLGEIDQSIG